MKITYQKERIENVFAYFVKGFDLKGKTLHDYKTTYDPRTGIVIFELITADKSKDS
jgi:hypothetical protein